MDAPTPSEPASQPQPINGSADNPRDMRGHDLRGADLGRVDYRHVLLEGARLDGAHLAGADLRGVSAPRCSLVGADLNGADLSGSDLRGADLSGATWEGTRLDGADLRDTNIAGVLGEPASLNGARINVATAKRSQLDDASVVRLWRAGILLLPLRDFSERVAVLCRPPAYSYVATRDDDASADEPPSANYAPTAQQLDRAARIQQAPAILSWRGRALAERQAATSHGSKNKANDGSTAAHDASAQVLKVDMVVLNARLRQRLDGSGVSEVWRARDAKRRMVAFKRLRDNTLPDRDLAEAAYARGVRVMEWLAGRDDRPNTIIRLYAASSDRLAWVSGWCANGNMEDLLALQWHRDKLVTFFMKVCEATAWAHRQGVLHRCIRPANVLLDDELQPTLSDFDLVDLSTVREKAFGDGGYRSYSAPEEIAGQGAQSPTADVYSLGKVLAFLLSGRHCAEPPSNAPQLDELTGAPAGLVRIVRRCCMADPTARYPQVDDLLGALHHYQHGGANAAEQKLKRPMLARKRLSALPAQRRWLQDEPDPKSARKRKPKSEQAPNSKKTAPIAGATVAQRLRAGNFALPGAALLPRRQQLLVAAAGLALVLMAAAGMLLQPVPTDWSVMVTTIIMASGAAGMTMLLPAMQLSNVRRMRLLGGAVAALLVFAVGLQPLVKWRLQRTLVHGSQQQRVAALTALLTRGVRDFPGLEMSGVDLTDIDFSEADLSGAKLNGTNLSGAMLTEADLRGASVVGARIDGADTSESTIVEAQGWTSVHCDGESSMPFGWYCLDGAPANDTTMDKTPADNAPADNPPPTTEGEWLPPAN